MEQRRRDLRAGEEHKSAFVQPGMGEGQGFAPENQVAVKEQIEIKGAFGPARTADAPMFLLDGLQQLQQVQGREDGFNLNDCVEIQPLSGRPAARLTFVQRRSREAADPRRRAQLLPRCQKMDMAVTEVGTESDKSAGRGGKGGEHEGN